MPRRRLAHGAIIAVPHDDALQARRRPFSLKREQENGNRLGG
jgi:hypothetical protein